jgi:hypothetical protein
VIVVGVVELVDVLELVSVVMVVELVDVLELVIVVGVGAKCRISEGEDAPELNDKALLVAEVSKLSKLEQVADDERDIQSLGAAVV